MKKKFLTWKNKVCKKFFTQEKIGCKEGRAENRKGIGDSVKRSILKRWVKKTGFEFQFPTCEFTKSSLTWKQITCKKVPNMKG